MCLSNSAKSGSSSDMVMRVRSAMGHRCLAAVRRTALDSFVSMLHQPDAQARAQYPSLTRRVGAALKITRGACESQAAHEKSPAVSPGFGLFDCSLSPYKLTHGAARRDQLDRPAVLGAIPRVQRHAQRVINRR